MSTQLKSRTKLFALRILKLVESMPDSKSGRIVSNQIGRAGTSVGANYRAACRARSKAEFIAKLGTVEEEADECAYWLEIIDDAQLLPSSRISDLQKEADEILKITVASLRTAARTRQSKT